MTALAHPLNLADLIPTADLARGARLAFDTLLAILTDKAAGLRDKRMAAAAVLRLTLPDLGRGRKPVPNQSSAHMPTPPPPPTTSAAPTSVAPTSVAPTSVAAGAPPEGARPEPSSLSPASSLIASAGAVHRRHSPVQPRAA